MARRQRGRQPNGSKTEQLEAVRREVAACESEAQQFVQEEQAARVALGESEETLVKALVHSNSAKTEQKAFEAARARAGEPWPQKHEAARRKISLAKDEVNSFISVNYEDLVAELRPRADAALRRIEAAFAAAAQAVDEWHEVVSVWEGHADALEDPQRRSPDSTGLDERILDLSNFTVPDPIGSLSPAAEAKLGEPVPPTEEAPPVAPEAPPVAPETPPVAEETPPVAEEAPPAAEEVPPVAEDTPPAAEPAPVEPAPAVLVPTAATPPVVEDGKPTGSSAPRDGPTVASVAVPDPVASPPRRRGGLLRWRRSPPREQIP